MFSESQLREVKQLDLFEFLNENYLMLVPALWVLGYALKQTPMLPDWSIIWVISFVSLVLAMFTFGFHPEAFLNALTAAGVAVFGHQLVKQTKGAKSNGS